MKNIIIITTIILFMTGCAANLPSAYDVGKLEKEINGKNAIEQDAIDLNDASIKMKKYKTPLSIQEYVRTGITSSNLLCKDWFEQMLAQDKILDHNQGLANILGDSALGIGGLSGVSEKSMAIFAIALGATNSAVDNYKGYFRLTDTLPIVFEKLKHARVIYKNLLMSKAINFTIKEAQDELRNFHASCSRMVVERVISESVSLATVKPAYVKPDTDFETQGELSDASIFIHKTIWKDDGKLQTSRLFALYLINSLDLTNADDRSLMDTLKKDYYNVSLQNEYDTLKASVDSTDIRNFIKLQVKLDRAAQILGFYQIMPDLRDSLSKITKFKGELKAVKSAISQFDTDHSTDNDHKVVDKNTYQSAQEKLKELKLRIFGLFEVDIESLDGAEKLAAEKYQKIITLYEGRQSYGIELAKAINVSNTLLLGERTTTNITGIKVTK